MSGMYDLERKPALSAPRTLMDINVPAGVRRVFRKAAATADGETKQDAAYRALCAQWLQLDSRGRSALVRKARECFKDQEVTS